MAHFVPESSSVPAADSRPSALAHGRVNPLKALPVTLYENPVATLPGPAGRVHYLQDPDAIRVVLTDKAGVYARSRLQNQLLGPLLGNGLLAAEGKVWRHHRQALTPWFRIDEKAPFLAQLRPRAEDMAATWRTGALDIDPSLRALAFEAMTDFLLGPNVGDAAAFQTAIEGYLDAVGAAGLDTTPGGAAGLSQNAGSDTIAALRREIKRALANTDTPLIRTLKEIHDGEDGVIDELATLLFAGTEAPAAAIAWGLYCLSRAPEAQAAVRYDLGHGGALAIPFGKPGRVHAVGRVFAETLRLYPPSLVISRDCRRTHDLIGREVRRGDTVMISQWVVHRHKRLWRDPARFDPGRFLPASSEPIHKFAYLPFGGGPHVCLGTAMAESMFRTVAGAVLERFDLLPADTAAVPTAWVTLRPENGIDVVLTPRR